MRRLATMIALTVALFLLGNIILRFAGVMVWDDAYFFGRYADNFWEIGSWSWDIKSTPEYGLTSLAYGGFILGFRILDAPMASTLWSASFLWGVAMLFLLYFLIRKVRVPNNSQTAIPGILLMISLGFSIPQMAAHFTSGMDTTMGMTFCAGYLMLFKIWENKLSPGKAFVLGILGASAYLVRPELTLFSFAIPVATFLWDTRKVIKRQALFILLFTACFLLGIVVLTTDQLASPYPLSFEAKTIYGYGASFAELYHAFSLKQLGWFALINIIPFAMIVSGMSTGIKHWWGSLSPGERGMALALPLFLIYETVFVLQVMGYNQRFFMPILPVLYLLAARSFAIFLQARTDLFAEGKVKLKTNIQVAAVVVLSGVLLLITAINRPANVSRDWGKFDIHHIYSSIGEHNWPLLLEWSEFPDDLKLASTELGIPGIIHSKKRIIDLSGLLGAEYYGVKEVLVWLPDVVYLPHPDYVDMQKGFDNSEDFNTAYEIYPASTLQSYLGIAIYRESPYYEAIRMRIMEHLESL